MDTRRFILLTTTIYFMNGSLYDIVNDDHTSIRAAPNPYIIDYLINKNKQDYKPNIGLELKKYERLNK
jgi:hypothetical protein